MQTYVVLLRGVMPSGKNRVPMADLRAALSDAGFDAPRTYIQSGNVILTSALDRGQLEARVAAVIESEIGPTLTVVARTVDELRGILSGNPFTADEAARTYFTVLQEHPSDPLAEDFHAFDFSPETISLVGDVIYTRYATKHSDARFTNNFFERKLRVGATTRNFNTMTKLIDLAS